MRRIKANVSAGTVYSTISSVSYSAGFTTVTVVNDSSTLDSGLSAIYYGLLNPAHPSIMIFPVGTRMAFFQASAPLGWTQHTGYANHMMRIVSGTGGGSGGIDSPILNNVVPSHTHTFTTGNESAQHTHSYNAPDAPGGLYAVGGFTAAVQSFTASVTGVESATHTHSGTVNANGSAADWSPLYMDWILATYG
jgi:hypothetical protein